MDKLSNRLRLVRSQSMGVGMGTGSGDKAGMAAAAARRNVQTAAGSGESSTTPDTGRNASIILLDERRLEMHIQPRMYAGELLDLVSAHCQLKEREFFGLAVVDENGHYQWLQLDRKVLDHDLPRKPVTLTVHFLVKFFIESISHLAENRTVELFYLQARSLIFRGTLEVDSDIVFQLASLALQASYGDYVDDQSTRTLVKKSPILPASVLKEHPSLTFCEDQVIENYRKTKGQTRGQAVVNYMTIVESMPTYGVHYFEVYDKRQTPWWLGLSCRGIAQYGYSDRKVPVRVFQWKQLENLYFRDKKFSIEVHDAKRVVQTVSSFNLYEDALKLEGDSKEAVAAAAAAKTGDKKDELVDAIADSTTQVSVSRRSFNPGAIHVYVWFGKTQSLTKCIWQSAISQHQFYLDRKQAKMRHVPVRTLKEIARDLTRSSASLSSASSMSNLSRSGSTHSLAISGSLSVDDPEQSEETRRARMEMVAALKARREALISKLDEKNKLLKELCIKEGELTGELPPEIPLAPGEPVPQIRRRVGTEFALPEILLRKPMHSPEEEMVAKLELEYEIQSKITSAALKIANDSSAAKSVRKQRKISYQQSQRKLREIEAKLNSLKHMRQQRRSRRVVIGGSPEVNRAKDGRPKRGLSVPDLEVSLREDAESHLSISEEPDQLDGGTPTRSCPSSPRKPSHIDAAGSKLHHHSKGDSISLEASPQRAPRSSGYIPSSVYLRSSYRTKQFPTLSNQSPVSVAGVSHHDVGLPLSPDVAAAIGGSTRSATLPSPYRNKYEVPNTQVDSPVGLYNCPQQRTSQAFSSMDDLDALTANSVHLHPNYPPMMNPLSPGAVSANSPHRLTPTRSSFVNQHLLSHRDVLSQARAVISRAEAATAAAISTQQQGFKGTLERSSSNVSTAISRQTKLLPASGAAAKVSSRELPALPSSSKSMEDLDTLEALGVHGKSKLQYREVASTSVGINGAMTEGLSHLSSTSSLASTAKSHHLPNTEEYPTHHHPSSIHRPPSYHNHSPGGGGLRGLAAMSAAAAAVMDERNHGSVQPSGPYPTALGSHSSTLLPGQTYPEPTVAKYSSGMNTLQEVFYHREMRLAAQAAMRPGSLASSTSRKSDMGTNPPPLPPPPKNKDSKKSGEESPPPPLCPKQYHQVVEQRRRSGLDRPTATAVPPKTIVEQSPAVDRKIKPPSSVSQEESDNVDAVNNNPQQQAKYFRETTKPFEVSDFYKYSTKYRKTSVGGLAKSDTSSINGVMASTQGDADSDSSPRSSTASGGSSGGGPPPEIPARPTPQGSIGGSPVKVPPPPPPKSEKLSNFAATCQNPGANNNKDSLADSFCSEMLDWYNKKSTSSSASSTATSSTTTATSSNGNTAVTGSSDSNKPATLV